MNTVMLVVILISVLQCVYAMNSSKYIEGYPEGYLADCPGSTKPAIFKKKTLKKIGIVVVGSKSNLISSGRKYNYYQAKQLAKDPDLDFKKMTVFFVGGYLDSPNFFVSRVMGTAYKQFDINVLLMEANHFLTVHYPLSVRLMRPVARHLAEMLTNVTAAGMDPKRIHIVGVSLGGQVISFIAKHFYKLTGTKIARLTALDPSGPCFRNLGPDERIDRSDADFVDVLNTNIDGFGMAAPVGHVNFYVNGGEYQPGDIYWLPCNVLCSHTRSYTLWLAALRFPDSFIAVKCDSVQQARSHQCFDRTPLETNVLGYKTDKNNTGIFYLTTDNVFPYYMGENGTKKEFTFWRRRVSEFNGEDVVEMK